MFTLARFLSFIVLAICNNACTPRTYAYERDSIETTVRPLESAASAETKTLIRELFERSDVIEFRFTPIDQIEIRAYEPDIERMRYSYAYRCGPHCELFAQKLELRLSTLRRAEGKCPRITAAILFRDDHDDVLATFYVDSTGHCLLIDGRVYMLTPPQSLAQFFEAFDEVFE